MNSKMITNSQLSTTESKIITTTKTNTKQTTRTRIESQKWRSCGSLASGRGEAEDGGKGTGNKQHNWQVQNRQGQVKNSIGNVEVKELICATHGHELRGEGMLVGRGCREEGNKVEGKNGTTVKA